MQRLANVAGAAFVKPVLGKFGGSMFKRFILRATAALSLLAGAPALASEVMTFDDLDLGPSQPVTGYHGFLWINAYLVNDAQVAAQYGTDNGYTTGIVSPHNALTNGWGDGGGFVSTSQETFSLLSADFTAATADDLVFQVIGYTLSGQQLRMDLPLNTNAPQNIVFNWSNLLGVTYYGYSPSQQGIPGQPIANIAVIDNIVIDRPGAVPEPATWAMMLAGFGAVGFAMRRQRQTTQVRYAF